MDSPQANRTLLLAGLAAIVVVLVALSGYYLGSKSTRDDRFASPNPSVNESILPSEMPQETPTDLPTSFPESEDPVMCTLEAKLCPDGSYVGRTGPKCEFSLCPGEVQAPLLQVSP